MYFAKNVALPIAVDVPPMPTRPGSRGKALTTLMGSRNPTDPFPPKIVFSSPKRWR